LGPHGQGSESANEKGKQKHPARVESWSHLIQCNGNRLAPS
jgi:hypothetical protein